MPRQLDKLNPHMDKEARKGINSLSTGYTDEEWEEIQRSLSEGEVKDVLNITLGPVCYDFVHEHNYLSTIMGPVGSGKSTGSILKIFLYSMCIMKSKNGKRKSRWFVVRNTKVQLKDTTIKTFLEWLGPYGRFEKSTLTFYMDFDDVQSEIRFLALDDAKDAAKLLSLEMTGIYFNEVSEIDKDIWNKAQGRIGRYPSLKATGSKAWFDLKRAEELGIIIDKNKQYEDIEIKIKGEYQTVRFYKMDCIFSDTNPPLMGSYFQKLFEKQLINESGVDENPKDFKLYRQPSGMSPFAENKEFLKSRYYESMLENQSKEYTDVAVHVQYGLGENGLGVYRNSFKEEHISKEIDKSKIYRRHRLIIGMDFGLTPACVIGQIGEDGILRIFDEIYAKNNDKMHLKDFLDFNVEPFLQKHYNNFYSNKKNILFVVDPAGFQRNQVNGETAIREIRDRGYFIRADSTNKLGERLSSVKEVFRKSKVLEDGKIKYLFEVSNKCDWLISGFRGNYFYEKSKDGFKDEPAKNEYSHIQDAFQYLCVHVIKYNNRHCLIDNISGNSYNKREVLDSDIGY